MLYDAIYFDPIYVREKTLLERHLREMTKEEKDRHKVPLKHWVTVYVSMPISVWKGASIDYKRDWILVSRAYVKSCDFLPTDFIWVEIENGVFGGTLIDETKRT